MSKTDHEKTIARMETARDTGRWDAFLATAKQHAANIRARGGMLSRLKAGIIGVVIQMCERTRPKE